MSLGTRFVQFLFVWVSFVLCAVAVAQESAAGVSSAPESATLKSSSSLVPASSAIGASDKGDLRLRSVSPRSLNAMRMHAASHPDEAALRCGLVESCVLGLTRGFALGGDWIGGLSSLIIQPQVKAGGWILSDIFGAYQFLSEQNFYANARLGMRYSRHADSVGNVVSSRALTVGLNYAQDVFPAYTQGLLFEGSLTSSTSLNERPRLYSVTGAGANTRRSLGNFYDFSHRHPVLRVGFPADFEVINWKASHIDLPSDLRGYAHAEPYYAQNQLLLSDGFVWVERNLGLKLGTSLAYESRPDRIAQRFTAQVKGGVEFATASHNIELPEGSQGIDFDLPSRRAAGFYGDVVFSWQF
jgi:hypothetical protein